jgi:hypothetical protein
VIVAAAAVVRGARPVAMVTVAVAMAVPVLSVAAARVGELDARRGADLIAAGRRYASL